MWLHLQQLAWQTNEVPVSHLEFTYRVLEPFSGLYLFKRLPAASSSTPLAEDIGWVTGDGSLGERLVTILSLLFHHREPWLGKPLS